MLEETNKKTPLEWPINTRPITTHVSLGDELLKRTGQKQVISGHIVWGTTDSRQRFVTWQICLIVVSLAAIIWSLVPGSPLLQSSLRWFLASLWLFQYFFTVAYRLVMLFQSLAVLHFGKAYCTTEPALADHQLPRYTILVPLYREASIVQQLVSGIRALNYPTKLLEVFYLLRADDLETRNALNACGIQLGICERSQRGAAICQCRSEGDDDAAEQILLLPRDLPVGTKPAACNWGLAHATGELLVIFDAEDIPDPDQLRKAAAALRYAPPKVACVESSKRPYNGSASLITRIYEIEALNWQLLLLPGLASWGKLASLYGSGAHFRTEILRKLGGWDYYNVTEDSDLGIRLHRSGYLIALLNSITREEAASSLLDWMRQRTRWNKGLLQTYLKHTRKPLDLVRSLGPLRALGFSVMTGTTVLNQLVGLSTRIAPLVWAAIITMRIASPNKSQLASILFLPFVFTSTLFLLSLTSQVAGPLIARRWRLIPFVFLLPYYWLLVGVCAWRAVWQLMTSPFKWEKTSHRGAKVLPQS